MLILGLEGCTPATFTTIDARIAALRSLCTLSLSVGGAQVNARVCGGNASLHYQIVGNLDDVQLADRALGRIARDNAPLRPAVWVAMPGILELAKPCAVHSLCHSPCPLCCALQTRGALACRLCLCLVFSWRHCSGALTVHTCVVAWAKCLTMSQGESAIGMAAASGDDHTRWQLLLCCRARDGRSASG